MATANDILIRVRQRVGDTQKTNYSDEELIGYLNDAINFMSAELIAVKDPEMIKEFTVTDNTGATLPSDFYSFVGAYPVHLKPDTGVLKVFHLNSSFTGTINVRYFAYKQPIAALTDSVPFVNSVYHTILNQLTSIYTLNRNNLGIIQDTQLLEQIQAQIRAGKVSQATGGK